MLPEIKTAAQWAVLILVSLAAALAIVLVAIALFPATGPSSCRSGDVWLHQGETRGCVPYEAVIGDRHVDQ